MTVSHRRARVRQVPFTETMLGYDATASPWEALLTCWHDDPPVSRLEQLAIRDLLNDALDALPPRSAWVFNRIVVERQSYREVATMMSLSVGMVHKIMCQARELL